MSDEETRIDLPKFLVISPGTLLLGTYEVERALNPGGMARTYLTRHKDLNNTKHVIKVIKSEFTDALVTSLEITQSEADHKLIELLKHEAEALLTIHHDAVVGYQGFQKDVHYGHCLIMEYVEGPSLKEFLKQKSLTIPQFWQLRNRLADGLAAAHAKGIFHRDISPDNVILPEGKIEEAKLIDFGIAKWQKPSAKGTIIGSAFVGKYEYAAPEQFVAGKVGPYSDIYSLGLVLAEAILGKRLDMGYSEESARLARRSVPDLSSIPAELRPQFKAMLQPNPSDRPQTMSELLQRWPYPPKPHRVIETKNWAEKFKGWWVAGLSVTAVIIGIGIVQYIRKPDSSKSEHTVIDNPKLGQADRQGYLSISSTPDGAIVLANDNLAFIGVTPTIRSYIQTGNNTLIIRKTGYRDEKLVLEIKAGDDRSENIALRPLVNPDGL